MAENRTDHSTAHGQLSQDAPPHNKRGTLGAQGKATAKMSGGIQESQTPYSQGRTVTSAVHRPDTRVGGTHTDAFPSGSWTPPNKGRTS